MSDDLKCQHCGVPIQRSNHTDSWVHVNPNHRFRYAYCLKQPSKRAEPETPQADERPPDRIDDLRDRVLGLEGAVSRLWDEVKNLDAVAQATNEGRVNDLSDLHDRISELESDFRGVYLRGLGELISRFEAIEERFAPVPLVDLPSQKLIAARTLNGAISWATCSEGDGICRITTQLARDIVRLLEEG